MGYHPEFVEVTWVKLMNRFGGTATLSSPNQQPGSTSETTLEDGLTAARDALLSLQKQDGHWCFPLEADCTIPAEYILMMHFMDDIDVDLEVRLARFIREKQDPSMVAGRYTMAGIST